MRRTFLAEPHGYDPYNSVLTGWVFDRDEWSLNQIRELLAPEKSLEFDMSVAKPAPIMCEYPLL